MSVRILTALLCLLPVFPGQATAVFEKVLDGGLSDPGCSGGGPCTGTAYLQNF